MGRITAFTRPSLRLFSYFCGSWLFFRFRFSCLFATILLRCTIVFCFGKCRANFFNQHWVQYERSLPNTSKFVYSSNLVTFVLLRPSEWATVVLGAWGVNGCHVKQFHRKSFFVIW